MIGCARSTQAAKRNPLLRPPPPPRREQPADPSRRFLYRPPKPRHPADPLLRHRRRRKAERNLPPGFPRYEHRYPRNGRSRRRPHRKMWKRNRFGLSACGPGAHRMTSPRLPRLNCNRRRQRPASCRIGFRKSARRPPAKMNSWEAKTNPSSRLHYRAPRRPRPPEAGANPLGENRRLRKNREPPNLPRQRQPIRKFPTG